MIKFYTPTGRPVKRIGLYGRVSSKKQVDNTSLANQLDKERDFALEHGLEIVGEKTEAITGISRWGARIEFNDYLGMGDKGLLDGIVVDVPDRLGRGRALATLLDRAYKSDLAVIFANGEELDDTSLGVNLITTGVERKDIGRRAREGKLKSARQGGIVFAKSMYGYVIRRKYHPETGKRIEAWVEFEPEEIRHVQLMYHWLVDERVSLYGIRVKLYENKILPPEVKRQYGAWDQVPEDEDRKWCRASIRNILSNSAYTGQWFYNKLETTRKEIGSKMRLIKLNERDETEWICVQVPAAISQEVFERAQAVLRKNKQQHVGRPSKDPYLLKSLLFCSCGYRMAGTTARRTRAYRCWRNPTAIAEGKCTSYVNQQLADEVVWGYIEGLLLDPESLITGYEERQREAEKENVVLREQAETLRAEIQKATVKLSILLDRHLEGDIDKATYRRKKKEIEDTTRDAKLELAAAEAQLARGPFTEDDKAQLLAFCEEIRANLETATVEDKRQLLLMLDVKVTYLAEEKALKVDGAFPSQKLSITPQ